MKTKLLKKIRKQFSWYFNKDGFPVVINHEKQEVDIYDLEYCSKRIGYTLEEVEVKVKVSHQEWALRLLKNDILKPYGYKLQRNWYKLAVKKLKQKQAHENSKGE